MSLLVRARSFAVVRGPFGLRRLAGAVDLKGIGSPADLSDIMLDGKPVVKMEPTDLTAGSHKNLPSLPPKMVIDWNAITDDLDDEAKKEVFAIKAMIDRQMREIDAKREELAGSSDIDWAKWEAEMTSPNQKKLLDVMKANIDSWSFDATEINAAIDQYRADIKEMETVIAAEKTKIESDIEMLEKQKESLKVRMENVKTTTIAQLMEDDPEMAVEIEDEIRGDNWHA